MSCTRRSRWRGSGTRSNIQPITTCHTVLVIANKTTAAGREAYRDTRRQSRAAGASVVEIDLVLQGEPTLDFSRDGLPDWDYAVTVTRSTKPAKASLAAIVVACWPARMSSNLLNIPWIKYLRRGDDATPLAIAVGGRVPREPQV